MCNTTSFVAELVRAANEVHLLTLGERRRLIERAAATIAAQRKLLEVRRNVAPLSRGMVADLDTMMRDAPEGPDALVALTLLLCAEEIRRLRILAGE